MSFDLKNIGKLMEQAQNMQKLVTEAQKKLADLDIEAEAAGGLVKLVITGKHRVRQVSIDASLLPGMSQEDKETLEGILAAGFNTAIDKADKVIAEKMAEIFPPGTLPPGGLGGLGGL